MKDEKLRQTIREIDWDEDSSVTHVINFTPPRGEPDLKERAFDWAISLPRWQFVLVLAYVAGAAYFGHLYGWF